MQVHFPRRFAEYWAKFQDKLARKFGSDSLSGLSKRHFPTVAQLRRTVPLAGIAIGAALLVYVASQYWIMYSEQRHLASEWQQQQDQRLATTTTEGVKSKVVHDDLTRLSIPEIHLNAVVVEGSSHKALLLGPGHMEDTPAPGEVGNSVISGHRDTFFRHIHELKEGDTLTVQRSGKSFTYEVTGTKIVPPTDVSVLASSPDKRLTLITCYPTYYIGPAPKRLVVFAKIASTANAKVEAEAVAGAAHLATAAVAK